MNRNRHNVARDVTTRMIQREAKPSDTGAWLRTLHELRTLPEVAV